MDDLGSILYLVFTVAAVIFSIVKKSNQNKNKKAVTSDSATAPKSGSKDVLEDIFPQLKGMFEPQVEKPTFIKEEPTSKPKPVVNKRSYEFEKTRKTTLRSSEKTSLKTKVKEKNQESIKREVKYENHWFDARQAIIYSEILKRPDF